MRPISITSLIDLELARPNQRLRRVREIRSLYNRSEEFDFDPDYYRPLRTEVIKSVVSGEMDGLDSLIALTAGSKARHFRACAEGYRRWALKQRPRWGGGTRMTRYEANGLVIHVNPEFVTDCSGELTVVKLYCKEPEPTKADLVAPLLLLDMATSNWRREGSHVGIFDLRRGRIHRAHGLPRDTRVLLSSEMEYLASMWARIDEEERRS